MKEMVWVDFELAGYKRGGELPDKLRSLRALMEKLVNMVVGVKDESFSISKNMLLSICVILEMGSAKAEDAWQRLPEQLTSSGTFIDVLKELKAMCEDSQCKDILGRVQDQYASSCRRLAEAYESKVYNQTEQKLLLFRQQNQGSSFLEKENELERENKDARERRKEVFAFCKKYRIDG